MLKAEASPHIQKSNKSISFFWRVPKKRFAERAIVCASLIADAGHVRVQFSFTAVTADVCVSGYRLADE
jgi:hypothetical protein